jgi:hypothetical protein
MIERVPGADVGGEQGVDQSAVVVETLDLGALVPVGWMRGQEMEKR